MATMPPPYSQRDAARAQRYYLRSLRRRSMVGPVVLILIGVLALLVETNHLNAFRLWEWYQRWWPLLLIGVGLLGLGEYWLDRGSAYQVGRSHGGVIALILGFAVFSYTSSGMRGMHLFGHGDEGDDLFSHLLGQEHDDDSSLNQALPAGALIAIQVPHGDVTVTPSGDAEIHVQAHQVVYAANERAARRDLEALAPKLSVDGKSVTLRAASNHDGRADLTIEIPAGAVPTVTAAHGDVTIEGLAVPVTVDAEHGDLKVDNVHGEVHLRIGKGDATVHALAGDLTLQGHMDDVSLSDVEGKVALDGDFFGDTNLAHIASAVHFHSSRTDVEVASIPGDLSIDSGDLQLNNAAGPARITTSAKDVECAGIRGDLRLEDSNGDITVGAIAPLGSLDLHNRNGAINLTVPQEASFTLQASAKNGDIDSKLNLPVTGSGEGHSVAGQVGSGGPHIEVVADHGDINLTARDIPSTPPAPPMIIPPAPPVRGAKPPRHLHPGGGAPNAQPVEQ